MTRVLHNALSTALLSHWRLDQSTLQAVQTHLWGPKIYQSPGPDKRASVMGFHVLGFRGHAMPGGLNHCMNSDRTAPMLTKERKRDMKRGRRGQPRLPRRQPVLQIRFTGPKREQRLFFSFCVPLPQFALHLHSTWYMPSANASQCYPRLGTFR